MGSLLRCILGPRLYRIHRHPAGQEDGRPYVPNMMETGSDTVIKWVKLCVSLSYYTSPILAGFLYRRGYMSIEGGYSLARLLSNVGSIFLLSWFLRGLGRYRNEDYIQFLEVLLAAQENPSESNLKSLSRYDFEFSAWPVNFRWDSTQDYSERRPIGKIRSQKMFGIGALPCDILSYVLAHTIGIGMVYPGSTAMIGALISPALVDGRSKLYEEHGGKRAKLLTRDGNEIDTMFLDRRLSGFGERGRYLVICSEGNSGFYEVGCVVTPTEGGYSVLGWNHPGFGGSTGRPFPSQEQNAMDCVIQYAIHQLKFPLDKIYLFAWSIGGYSAAWAAMNYPDLKGVILDATFDDLVPLAVARMPRSWKTLVTMTVRRYINLNIAEQLCHYPGPVLLIRRFRDEMITTEDAFTVSSNRGNDLLVRLLQYRYPEIVCESTLPVLRRWLGGGSVTHDHISQEYDVDDQICHQTLVSVNHTFPSKFGMQYDEATKIKYAVFLAGRYMLDYDSSHCTPLPVSFFTDPWSHGVAVTDEDSAKSNTDSDQSEGDR